MGFQMQNRGAYTFPKIETVITALEEQIICHTYKKLKKIRLILKDILTAIAFYYTFTPIAIVQNGGLEK